jgi:hypothetical protein
LRGDAHGDAAKLALSARYVAADLETKGNLEIKMTNEQEASHQEGTGYLVLKSGATSTVGWGIDILADGTIHSGIVRGDEEHLASAAQDGCATLQLSSLTAAAICIDSHADGKRPLRLYWFWVHVFKHR